MTERWIHSKDAPRSAELIGSLPVIEVSKERTRQLEQQLMVRLRDGSSGRFPMGAPLKLALALVAVGGIATAGTIGVRALDSSSPTQPAATPVDQRIEPVVDKRHRVSASPRAAETQLPPPAELGGSQTQPEPATRRVMS